MAQALSPEEDADLERRAAELRIDPRTGIELVDVPPEHRAGFEELEGKLMYWFSKILVVSLRTSTGKERVTERYLLVTDSCVFVLEEGRYINRCYRIKDIKELITSRENDLGLQMPDGPQRFDLMLCFPGPSDRDAVLAIIKKAYHYEQDRALPVRQVDVMKEALTLKKPENWRLETEQIIPKKLLLQRLSEQKHEYTQEQQVINEEFERLKGKLQEGFDRQIQHRNEEYAQFKRDYQHLQDAHNNLVVQYDSMAQDVETYVRMLNEKDEEIARYTSGDHPALIRMEHEVEKLRLRQELEEQKVKGETHSELGLKDRELAHLRERLHEKEEAEERLRDEVQRCRADLAAADAAVSERDDLLRAREVELQDRQEEVGEKERELRYTRSLMREAFKRQTDELEQIRLQFAQYDHQMVSFISKISGQPVPSLPATAAAPDLGFNTHLPPSHNPHDIWNAGAAAVVAAAGPPSPSRLTSFSPPAPSRQQPSYPSLSSSYPGVHPAASAPFPTQSPFAL